MGDSLEIARDVPGMRVSTFQWVRSVEVVGDGGFVGFTTKRKCQYAMSTFGRKLLFKHLAQ